MENRIWLKGDTHLHTCNSDGKLTPGQLVEACQQAGLDYAIITDHNYNTVKASYTDKNLLVMQGQEITDDLGHINVWGKKVPQDPPYILKTTEDYDAVLAPCREAGATISVNHPFCSMCGFHMDLEHFHFDCVEVWNTIHHSDNVKNMNWWHNQLLQGNHIAAVGGSDFHKDIAEAAGQPHHHCAHHRQNRGSCFAGTARGSLRGNQQTGHQYDLPDRRGRQCGRHGVLRARPDR